MGLRGAAHGEVKPDTVPPRDPQAHLREARQRFPALLL
ncbi:hypothetical protein PC119_g23213 [Phytophthora cactorum]|uniref:Uncharacterized protein n=1 Tax=Phytophthora cactorum TaxID=29920 RepID=A0A8T1B5R9_9STRA|nr:hypothetical protein PC114_g23696 [Phytophthora cactorum]KAG2894383.1 hypothetical protein PC117_g23503 [Phytophthora cactorum]KAG2972273.1 hypothetical protein PC119_g23213 [Phytophthora cactorum]KAG3001708.1 hypothetical protein PC120_g20121 [Phytophthora cactorum]KAG3056099.1 hypothetical protein PC122_g21511 [Phytophthora cactorum]